ncbi:MAG: metallo-beta-lactamase [Rhodobacter sp. CACIA14H1]|nr:MAG: metallo-beta-lactamase [Rhodobacter sp. CACIA14H1]
MTLQDTGIRHPFPDAPAEGQAVEIAEGILWLRLPLPMALDHVNVFALEDGDGWTVVDTGFSSKRAKGIWEALLAGPLSGKPVTRVIVTHYHPDHMGLAGWFQSRGAELVTTRTSWLYARMLVLDEHPLPLPEAVEFQRRAGVPADRLQRYATTRPFNFADVVDPLPPGFIRIRDGDTLSAAGRRWAVRTGDGHAPEHATLWSQDDNLILGGDQLLPGISANIGVYPTEPDADPLTEWLESCARLAPHAREDQLVLPGHKLPFTGLPLRLRQIAENHEGALSRLLDHLQAPRTAADCFLPIFKRQIDGPEYGMALVESVAHLNCLLRRGQVTRTLSPQGAWLWERRS